MIYEDEDMYISRRGEVSLKKDTTYDDEYWEAHDEQDRCPFTLNKARCHLPREHDSAHARNCTVRECS